MYVVTEKNTIQLFFWFDPAHLAFRCKYPYASAARVLVLAARSNFSRLKGVPTGVRALLESRERHERRRRKQSIYSKYHDASMHAKISHRSL